MNADQKQSDPNSEAIRDAKDSRTNVPLIRRLAPGATLSLAPLLLFFTQAWALSHLPPFWRLLADPTYPYLLNGAAIVTGVVPGHVDHPGTTTQWLNGIVQWFAFNAMGEGKNLVADVVSRPETYLAVDAWVTIALQLGAFLYASWRIYKSLGLTAAFTFQAVSLPISYLVLFLVSPIPEATIWSFTLVLVGLLAVSAKQPRRPLPAGIVIAIGVVIGLGTASKVIFIPIALIVLVWLRTRDFIGVLVVSTVTGLLVLLPVRSKFREMWEWFSATASTTARYPDEPQTSSGLDSMVGSLQPVLTLFPMLGLALLLALSAVVFSLTSQRNRKRTVLQLSGPLLALFGLWLLTYKAWRPNDLIALSPTAGLLAGTAVFAIRDVLPTRAFLRRALVPSSVALLALSSAMFLTSAIQDISDTSKQTPYDEQLAYLEKRWSDGSTIANGYGVFNQASALYFANTWSNEIASQEIASAFPRWIEFSIWNLMFYTPTDDGPYLESCAAIQDFARSPGGLLIAPGREVDLGSSTLQYSSMVTAPEAQFGDFTVFRVINVSCPT